MTCAIDNGIYDKLNERWYTASDDPVALLRAEGRVKNPWIADYLRREREPSETQLLDVGAGAGFLANDLAERGFRVTAVDVSESSLAVGRRHDRTGTVDYRTADAYALPFEDASFAAVTMLDFLEHVEDPARAIREASRVLEPGGLFFFHTFDRTWLSYLFAVKGVEWFVNNTPRNMHVHSLFITPEELRSMAERAGLLVEALTGLRPRVETAAFWTLLATGDVPAEFEFALTRSTKIAYLGAARKGPARRTADAIPPRSERR